LKAPKFLFYPDSIMRRLLILFVLTLASCSSRNPVEASSVPLDRDFDLQVGARAEVEGSDVVIEFQEVTSDSRCPEGVQCIQAGDATVRLAVRGGGGGTRAVELHTHDEPNEAVHGTYFVRLVSLRPYPRDGQQIRPGDYVATLRVIRRP
jgi:hypothetical protein